MGNLTPELESLRRKTLALATDYGLDFFDVIFELVDYDELNMIAAYGGFPTRYPHWRYGMDYEHMSKSYAWGLSKVYELVINNDPCYAYLMRSNSMTEQKLVMAHVYGHSDFFKNNLWFSKTSRKMMDVLANHGARIRRFMDQYGVERVESFIDTVLSLDNLIDVYAPFIKRGDGDGELSDGGDREAGSSFKIEAKDYMDRYINPPEYIRECRENEEVRIAALENKFPANPERDVLGFMLRHAALEDWEQSVLSMLREEAYYFAPQGMTKIMNEGWAVYWHSKFMTSHLLEASEVISYADSHSGALSAEPGQINPYKLGLELFLDIEERWDKGKYGPEFERCEDAEQRRNWDTREGKGREKIFQVRKIYNDVTFVDDFVDADFAEKQKLFIYGFNEAEGRYEIVDRDYRKVKGQLLNSLTNFGNPVITVADGNYMNRGELYLHHDWMGVDLQFEQALRTLGLLQSMWKRPVHLETREAGKPRLLSHDGSQAEMKEISGSSEAPELVGVDDGGRD